MNEEKQADCYIVHDFNSTKPDIDPHIKGNRPGDLCPICQTKELDYNGLMLLVCPDCGPIEGGSYT